MCVLPTQRRPWQPRCGLCLADLDGDSLNPDPGEPGVDAFSPNAKVGKSDSCSDRPDAGPAASDADTYNLNRDPDEPDVDPASLNPASDGRALDAGKPNVNPGNHILDPVSLDAGCVESAAEPARPNDPSAPPKWRPARVIRPWATSSSGLKIWMATRSVQMRCLTIQTETVKSASGGRSTRRLCLSPPGRPRFRTTAP